MQTSEIIQKIQNDELNDKFLDIYQDLTDEYVAVPKEMKLIANYFKKEVLRDVDFDDFAKNIPTLKNQFGDRSVLRAMHFFLKI